jgi:hypothetical protein
MKHKWGEDSYTDECIRKWRMGTIWLNADIGKLRGIKRKSERGRCPLCFGEQDAKYVLLKNTLNEKEGIICMP